MSCGYGGYVDTWEAKRAVQKDGAVEVGNCCGVLYFLQQNPVNHMSVDVALRAVYGKKPDNFFPGHVVFENFKELERYVRNRYPENAVFE